MWHRRIAFVILVLAGALPVLAKNAPTIRFEDHAVVASVTPGASTAWLLVAQHPTGRGEKLIHGSEIIEDTDNDGVIRVPLAQTPSPTSVWVVVDLSSGDYAIEAPQGPAMRRKLPQSALQSKGNGKPARVFQQGRLVVVLMARPGVGAWMGMIRDGSAAENDGPSDANVAARLETLGPVGNSPVPPTDYQKDDVVVFADLNTLAVYDARITH